MSINLYETYWWSTILVSNLLNFNFFILFLKTWYQSFSRSFTLKPTSKVATYIFIIIFSIIWLHWIKFFNNCLLGSLLNLYKVIFNHRRRLWLILFHISRLWFLLLRRIFLNRYFRIFFNLNLLIRILFIKNLVILLKFL